MKTKRLYIGIGILLIVCLVGYAIADGLGLTNTSISPEDADRELIENYYNLTWDLQVSTCIKQFGSTKCLISYRQSGFFPDTQNYLIDYRNKTSLQIRNISDFMYENYLILEADSIRQKLEVPEIIDTSGTATISSK